MAPKSWMTSAVAIKVKGVVKTASPLPIPFANSDMSNASVPEAQVTQYFVPA